MKSSFWVRGAVGATVAALLPAAAFAQAGWTPATEVIGQPIQVTTNGVTNTVYLDSGGVLRILTPNGTTVPGTWTATNAQLCVGVGGPTECIPYASPFQAGVPEDLTSSCGARETWLAQNINQPPPPPPEQGQKGERGR